jgi:hypothetical protein
MKTWRAWLWCRVCNCHTRHTDGYCLACLKREQEKKANAATNRAKNGATAK